MKGFRLGFDFLCLRASGTSNLADCLTKLHAPYDFFSAAFLGFLLASEVVPNGLPSTCVAG